MASSGGTPGECKIEDDESVAFKLTELVERFVSSWVVVLTGVVLTVTTMFDYAPPTGVCSDPYTRPPALPTVSVKMSVKGNGTIVAAICSCTGGCTGGHEDTRYVKSRTYYDEHSKALVMDTDHHLGELVVHGSVVELWFCNGESVGDIANYLCANVFSALVIPGSDPAHDQYAWNSECGLGPATSGPDDLMKNWDPRLSLGMPDKNHWYISRVDKVIYKMMCPCYICAQWRHDHGTVTEADDAFRHSTVAFAATATATAELPLLNGSENPEEDVDGGPVVDYGPIVPRRET